MTYFFLSDVDREIHTYIVEKMQSFALTFRD